MLQFLLKRIFTFLVLFSSSIAYSQQIIDSCFTSTTIGTGFNASINLTSLNGDLMQWNGSSWSGGWPGANITIAPPTGGSGCRAIWCGSGSVWTTGGEGFGIRLNGPLVAGQTYTYNFTTVSHGVGSDGIFSPMLYTNTSGAVGGVLVGNLTPAGNTWVTNAFTFTATAAQAGHTWLVIFTGPSGSSGFVNNFCTPCNIPQTTNCNVDLGPDLNLCPGQTATLNASTPGATYLWSNNSTGPTLTVTQAGTYTVAINVNGCTDTDAVTVTYGTNPTVNLGPDVNFCTPQTLNLNATFPNSTYLWQNGSTGPTFAVTQSGTYSVSVTNSCGTTTDNIVVNYITPAVNLGPDVTLCPGQTSTLNATTPGATYLWSDNSTGPTLTVNQAGTYSVTTTVSGCTATDAVTVTSGIIPTVNLGQDLTLCSPQTASLDATFPNSTYLWQNNSTSPTFNVTQSGTYSVAVTNSCGTVSDNVLVTINAAPVFDLGPDLTICVGQTIDLDATTPNATYVWQDNSTNPIFTASQAGNYSVVASIGNCSSTDDIDITVVTSPLINLGNDTILCEGQSLILNATIIGATYLWQDNSTGPTFTVSQSGTYTVDLVSSCGSTSDAIQVDFIPLPVVNLGNDTSFCIGGNVLLDASNANGTYVWQDNSTNSTYAVNQSGTYSVSVSNVIGCSSTDAIIVTVNPIPTVSAGADLSLCQGSLITLSGSGANTYSWDNGVTNGTPFSPPIGSTVYTVTGTSAAGCTDTDEVTVVVGNAPAITFTADVTEGCTPLLVNLTNTTPGASNCVWTLSDGTIITGCGTIPVLFEQEGCFDVTLTTELSGGCFGTSTEVDYICTENPPIASFNAVPQQVTAFDPTVYFNNTSSGASAYVWNFGDSTQLSTLTNPEHQYPFGVANSYPVMLIATTPFGCSDTAYSYVQVLEELIYYVPNSFTPDGDIFNQTFQPVFTSGFDPYNYNLRIFNRWGAVIFESADAEVGWDGSYTLNGNILPCQSGVYTWKIEFKSPENDEKQVIHGHVSLLR
jgi:gliding motility-associated-like protein